jgi:branched-subunit amino acid transport protein
VSAWLAILAVGIGSFVLRVGPLFVLQRVPLAEGADRIIRRAGMAAIAALVASSVRHSATTGSTAPALVSFAVATILAMRGASMIRLVACGGAIYAAGAVAMGLLA